MLEEADPSGASGSSSEEDIPWLRCSRISSMAKSASTCRAAQVYNSLILATWYKKKIKDSILEQVYADKNKVAGIVSLRGSETTKAIYQRYLQAFKKGEYNYIKEEIDPATRQSIPRKYFSGGAALMNVRIDPAMASQVQMAGQDHMLDLRVILGEAKQSQADHAMRTASLLEEQELRAMIGAAEAAVKGISDPLKQEQWHRAFEQAKAIVFGGLTENSVGKKKIYIDLDILMAYTVLSWLSSGGGNLKSLEDARKLFNSEFRDFNTKTMKHFSEYAVFLLKKSAADYQFSYRRWPQGSKQRQASNGLIQSIESLLRLHYFGNYYGMFAVSVEAKDILKTGTDVVNAGIYFFPKRQALVLARNGRQTRTLMSSLF